MEQNRLLRWALAKVIKKIREANGLTQGQLAGFAGLSESYLSRLECGEKSASLDALAQLADALQVKPSEIMHQIEDVLAHGPSEPSRKHGRPRNRR